MCRPGADDDDESMTTVPLPRNDFPYDVEFHRLARVRPGYRWWRPILTGLVGVALYLGLAGVVVVALATASLFVPTIGAAADSFMASSDAGSFDLEQPWLLATLLVPLIALIPVLFLASRLMQGCGVGLLSSVLGRIRWRWLGHTLLLALIVFTVAFALWIAVDTALGVPFEVRFDHPGIPLMLVIVLLLVPLQATAEEYVFRGYLMQLVGAWLRHPAFAILLPAPLFVLGHGYDIWGGLSVGAFAVVAGWLCWRTGGLEAAISMHIVNNVVIFVLASIGLVDGNATEGTPVDLLVQTAIIVVYSLLVIRAADRRGIRRRGGGMIRRTSRTEAADAAASPSEAPIAAQA